MYVDKNWNQISEKSQRIIIDRLTIFGIKHKVDNSINWKNNQAFPINFAFICDTIYSKEDIALFDLIHEVAHLLYWSYEERKKLFPISLLNEKNYVFDFNSPEDFVLIVSVLFCKNIKEIDIFEELYRNLFPYYEFTNKFPVDYKYLFNKLIQEEKYKDKINEIQTLLR